MEGGGSKAPVIDEKTDRRSVLVVARATNNLAIVMG
jgi:hypothetical protein